MALTKEDLLAISQLLDEKIKSALQTELQPLKEDIAVLKEDIAILKEDVAVLKEDVAVLKQEMTVLKEDVAVLKEEMAVLKEDVAVLKQEMADAKASITKIQLHLENVTDRNIRLLAENYVPAAAKYEKAIPELQTMRAEIDVMKKVIADHSQKLQALGCG